MASDERHERGLRTMAEVYSWGQVPELPGEYFKVTVDHLFGDIWNREGLSVRDRRLLLLGVIAALGETSVLPVQLDAALANDELTADQLREIAIFLTHYIGWPRGAAFNNHVEDRIAKHAGKGTIQRFPGPAKGDA
ncbi:MAG TPA: carboxymuconolactone decarboxylase family protein [Mycobacteriales bacterium]|jgi:4-carboxymuconolactone decarboxylase|nr:carboxymuconolactone decarboxylase family protein [Mycobacteriales bacterium]